MAKENLTDEEIMNCECICNACGRDGIALEDLVFYISQDQLTAVLDGVREDERGDDSAAPLTDEEMFHLSVLLANYVGDKGSEIEVALSDELSDFIKEAQERSREGLAASPGGSFLNWVQDSERRRN